MHISRCQIGTRLFGMERSKNIMSKIFNIIGLFIILYVLIAQTLSYNAFRFCKKNKECRNIACKYGKECKCNSLYNEFSTDNLVENVEKNCKVV